MKNPLCPRYDACLDNAADHNLPFSCADCCRRDDRIDSSVLIHDLPGCQELLSVVFEEERRRKALPLDEIRIALFECNGDRKKTAHLLGIHISTVHKKIRENPEYFRRAA